MKLVFDLRTLRALTRLPPGGKNRERRKVSIAEAIVLIRQERLKRFPRWKKFYRRHRKAEKSRQKSYRENHREQIAEHNRNYQRERRRQQKLAAGKAIVPEGDRDEVYLRIPDEEGVIA